MLRCAVDLSESAPSGRRRKSYFADVPLTRSSRALDWPGSIVMPTNNPRSTAKLFDRPFHAMLVPIPFVCFVGTLITDLVYWQSAAMLWADISAWLLVIGVIFSVLAATAGLIDFCGDRRVRELRAAWVHAVGNIAALILSVFNTLIHTRDAYTSVVPSGLILSALVVAILLVTGWNGWTLVYRHGIGVRPRDPQ